MLKVNALFIFNAVKVATGDVNITESPIGVVAGPGAQVGSATVVSQVNPLSIIEGLTDETMQSKQY